MPAVCRECSPGALRMVRTARVRTGIRVRILQHRFQRLGRHRIEGDENGLWLLMQRRVLTPLGLRDSFFSNDIARLSARAVGYDASAKQVPYYTTSTPPSGELYVSAHDLARFAMFHLKNRLTGQARILEDQWIDELHKPVFMGRGGLSSTFGWFTATLKSGAPYLFKGGGQPGVATKLYLLPRLDSAEGVHVVGGRWALAISLRSDGNTQEWWRGRANTPQSQLQQ